MAIITTGTLVGGISGSIGGQTYSHNKGGPYVRRRATPTNPNSTRQQTVRTIMGILASAWSNTLTDAQRATWSVYAEANTILNALGQAIKLTPLAWYLRCGARLLDAGAAAPTDAPTTPAPTGFATFTPSFTSTTAASVIYTAALAAGEHMQLWMTGPDTLGSSPNFNQAILVGYSAAAAASPIAFTLPRAVAVDSYATFFAARLDAQGLVSAYESLRVQSA